MSEAPTLSVLQERESDDGTARPLDSSLPTAEERDEAVVASEISDSREEGHG